MLASGPRRRLGRLLAGAALVGAFSLAATAFAASITDPAAVVVSAKPAESQLRPKPAPKAAVAKPAPPAAKAEPAEAEAAPAATGYLCLSNSCAQVAMLPMRSEADQAADAEAEAEAAVMSAANQIAGRLLSLSFTAGPAEDEADVVLTPVADDEEE